MSNHSSFEENEEIPIQKRRIEYPEVIVLTGSEDTSNNQQKTNREKFSKKKTQKNLFSSSSFLARVTFLVSLIFVFFLFLFRTFKLLKAAFSAVVNGEFNLKNDYLTTSWKYFVQSIFYFGACCIGFLVPKWGARILNANPDIK